MNSFCDTHLSLPRPLLFMGVFFYVYLHVINFSPIIRVLVIETVIGHVNMYLVKTN